MAGLPLRRWEFFFAAYGYFFSPRGYEAETTPEGAASNYVFAITRGDYDRAYGYLSPELENYPGSVDIFREEMVSPDILGQDVCPYFDSLEWEGATAVVKIRYQYYDSCIKIGIQNLSYNYVIIRMERVGDRWMVIDGDEFFNPAWRDDV